MENQEEVELVTHRAIIELPENAVEIDLQIKVFENGQLIAVGKTYSLGDIREMFRKADDGYIDDDDRFVITDEGLAWLEGQESKGG